GDRIGELLVRERELILGRPARDVLAVGAYRLAEAVVHEHAAAAGLPIQDAVEGLDARGPLGLVEAELHEIMHGAAGLRGAERVDILNVASERIGYALLVRLGA